MGEKRPYDVVLIPGDGIGPEITEAFHSKKLNQPRRSDHSRVFSKAGTMYSAQPMSMEVMKP